MGESSLQFLRRLARLVGRPKSEASRVRRAAKRGGGAGSRHQDRDTTAHNIGVPRRSAAVNRASEPRRGYTYLRRHKRGGLGSVWVVVDERAGRDVALKKLRRDLRDDPHSQQLIRTEARVTAQLQHPNIVPVYDLGLDDNGDFYYTMRFVRGRTLSEQIDIYTKDRSSPRLSRVNLHRVLDVFRGVCNAVAYAHSKGVVHLDLKPSNVLVGEFGEVILLDWGCAQPADTRGSGDGADVEGISDPRVTMGPSPSGLTGTPAYMAPEQIQGRRDEIGSATDVYQLGAILYEILTGHPPHREHSMTEIARRVRGDGADVDWAAEAVRSNPAVPPALAAICGRALAAHLEQRYPSVDELWREVENWMADEPVSVYRAGPISESLRWVRRHQKLATFIFVSACLLLLFHGQLLRLTVQERCNKLAHVLAREMRVCVGAVDALQGLFETRGEVSREEFARFADAYLQRFPQLAALEWIPAVADSERSSYERAVQASTWPSADVAKRFAFTERSADSRLVESSRRQVYFPVYYLEPYEGNEAAFGYDLGSSPRRLETLRHAAESRDLVLSAPIELVQASLGFLALSPVEDDDDPATTDQPKGYSLGVFKAEEVFARAWRGIDLEHLEVRVYDVSQATQAQLIWSNTASPEPAPPAARAGLWGASREVSLWNRRWLVVVRPKLSFTLLYPMSRLTEASEPV